MDIGRFEDTISSYGRSIVSSGTNINPFRYGGRSGYYQDGFAGMLLATNRWYSSALSRWMSRDPIEYRGGDHLYNYVANRPTYYLDPLGLDAVAGISEGQVQLDRHNGNADSAWQDMAATRMGSQWDARSPEGIIKRQGENYLWAYLSVQERGGICAAAIVEGVVLVPLWQGARLVRNAFGYAYIPPLRGTRSRQDS